MLLQFDLDSLIALQFHSFQLIVLHLLLNQIGNHQISFALLPLVPNLHQHLVLEHGFPIILTQIKKLINTSCINNIIDLTLSLIHVANSAASLTNT